MVSQEQVNIGDQEILTGTATPWRLGLRRDTICRPGRVLSYDERISEELENDSFLGITYRLVNCPSAASRFLTTRCVLRL